MPTSPVTTTTESGPQRSAVVRTDVKNAFEAPDWYFNKLNYRIRLRAQVVAEITRHLNFAKFIDIGCGDGSISIQLLTPNRQLTLQDLSSAMLKRAGSLVPEPLRNNVKFVEGDFREAGLELESYDLVICLGVLSYIDQLDPFLRQLDGLLKPGGNLIIECSDSAHPLSRLTYIYSWLAWNARGRPSVGIKLHSHTRRGVEAALAKLNFRMQKSIRYSTPLPLIRAVLGQNFHYRMNQTVHGLPNNPRLQALGSECIYHYSKPAR